MRKLFIITLAIFVLAGCDYLGYFDSSGGGNNNTCTISFNANGGNGTMPSVAVEKGTDYTIPAHGFTAPAMTAIPADAVGAGDSDEWYFAGWNTKADGSGTVYKASAVATITSDTTFYAQWKAARAFSVAENRQVYFSKGNLQATYSAGTSSYDWGFADHQYDYVGADPGNTSIDSQIDGAKVDLLYWSTTGTNYGIKNSASLSDILGDFIEWGLLFGVSSPWRTLTNAEGDYLLNTRSASTVGGTENARYAKVNLQVGVNKVYGLLIFPDVFAWTSSMGTAPTCNITDTDRSSAPTYTTVQFSEMEAAGCVFLPVGGKRSDESVGGVGSSDPSGGYWSSTAHNSYDTHAHYLYLDNNDVDPRYIERSYGFLVRLVCEE